MKLVKILFALTIETIDWFYPLVLTVIAGFLEAWLIFSRFPEINTLVLVAIFPLLYLFWLFLFLCLSALGTTLLFRFVKKPKFLEANLVEDWQSLLQFSPTNISYKLIGLIATFPFLNYFKGTPIPMKWLRNLVIRAYAPEVNIGKQSLVLMWLEDPDLTYVGDNVVIGTECHIVAHATNTTSDGKLRYISEPIVIGNKSTIGGSTRIGMGVKIEEEAIVEVGSNVLPYTRIGRGEIWGGNPAVFLRKRNEFANEAKPKSSQKQIASSQLNEIIANAIRLPLEEISDDLNSENCMAWDSLATMSIAASLYDRFSIRVPAKDIFKLNSCKSIEQLIAAHTDNNPDNSDAVSTPKQDTEIPNNPELLPLYNPEAVTQALARRFAESMPKGDKKIVIAATFTAQPLGSTLELWCKAFGISFSVEFGEFNQLEQTLLSPESVFISNQNGLNVVLTRPEDLISDGDQDGMIRASQLLDAISSYAENQKGLIVSNLPPAVSPFFMESINKSKNYAFGGKSNWKKWREFISLILPELLRKLDDKMHRMHHLRRSLALPIPK
ncbi:MAG: hypothetical protein HC773_20250 [Scytonema sp. CRU_2_7]|nr:hypothetical protein [Scytonema sp. CRU_2_7]